MEFKYGTPQEAGLYPRRVRQVEQLVNNWVEQQESQAFAFVIARKGNIVSHQAFGRLFPDHNSPNVSKDTISPLASLSKPITGTAALVIAERGQLSLSFPVSYYIPEFVGEGKEKVLLWHLMTHTSGLRDEDIYAHSEKKQGKEVPAHIQLSIQTSTVNYFPDMIRRFGRRRALKCLIAIMELNSWAKL